MIPAKLVSEILSLEVRPAYKTQMLLTLMPHVLTREKMGEDPAMHQNKGFVEKEMEGGLT